MGDPNNFAQMILRLRAGDQEAAVELVKAYQTEVHLEVRLWLHRRYPGLRRSFDSLGICQAVLGSFFLRVAAGQYDLDQPEQLRALLMAMARNKSAEQAKRHLRECRDVRRLRSLGPQHQEVVGNSPDPFDQVAGGELLSEFQKRLSAEERQLADMRLNGREWEAIAAELGGTPDARRRQLARAINRIAQELGLEELPSL